MSNELFLGRYNLFLRIIMEGDLKRKRGKVLFLVLIVLIGIWSVNTFAATQYQQQNKQSQQNPQSQHQGPQQIRAAYCGNMPPFQYTDSDGNAIGLHIDLLDDMAKECGMEVTYHSYQTREACTAALESGTVDVVLGYPVNSYESAKFQFTGELSKASVCMVARRGRRDAFAENSEPYSFSKAVFELGTIDYAYMKSMGIKQFMAVNSQKDVAQALLDGSTDVAIGTSESLGHILRHRGVQNQYSVLHDQITSISYSILLNSDNYRLRAVLDTELAELRTSGEYEKVYRKWITSRDAEQARHTIWKILIGGGVIVLFAALVIGFVTQINRILRKKVEEKTEALNQVNYLLEQQVIQLQNESSLRNRIIEAVPTGIIFLDRKFCVTVMNPAAQSMCGVYSDAVMGTDAKELSLFGELLQRLDQEMLLPRQREQQSYVVGLEEKEDLRKYRCWFHFLKDSSGGMLLMVEDVTREEQQRKEMFEKEKSQVLGRLVAGIAHELKNPLMNLKTAVSLILTQGDRPEVKEAFARFIPGEVDRMNRLVEGLLNYSRPTREKAEVVQLSEVVNSCLYLTNITAKRDQIRFSVELDTSLCVKVQKDMLRQSLINILMNSVWSVEKKQVDFPDMDREDSSIIVRVYEEDIWVCLSVYDRGIGMTEKEIRRCTDPFYTTKKAGTGLGLALTKQFVEENGGTLTITSEVGSYTELLLRFRRYEGYEK